MSKYRFRLLHGVHEVPPTLKLDANGDVVLDKKSGDPVHNNDQRRYVAKHHNRADTMEAGYTGDIIDTDLDLHTMFDQKGAIAKFQDITRGEAGVVDTKESLLAEKERIEARLKELSEPKPAFGTDTLESMTLEQLIQVAEADEITVPKGMKKADVIKLIQQAPVGAAK